MTSTGSFGEGYRRSLVSLSDRHMPLRSVLTCVIFAAALGAQEAGKPRAFEVEGLGIDGHRVADPKASGKLALAVSLEKPSGGLALAIAGEPFPPGRYRASLRLRSPKQNDTLVAGTAAQLSLRVGEDVLATRPCGRFSFSGPDEYEDLSLTFLLARKGRPRLVFTWLRDAEVSAEAAAETAPTTPNIATGDGEDEAGEMEAGVIELELKDVDFPCLLADRVTLERVGGDVLLERVWPQKVHCAPGEANPIDVRVLNVGTEERTVRVRATMVAGVEERTPLGERTVELDAGAAADLHFDWEATEREYGHEVRVELFDGDQLLDRGSEYFGVSRNIWQVAIQSPGFIEWVPLAHKIDGKVPADRRAYTNVYEAFSWAPCSFTDLTPDMEEWWTGQNNFHHNVHVLRRWMELAHRNGMKMITYSFPTACGAVGMEFARQHPDWITNWNIGLGISYTVQDLRWRRWAWERGKPFLATVSRQWHSAGIDRGHLGAINFGAEEIVRSARTHGWDGVRFDGIWRWSPLGGEHVQRQFEELGIEAEARKLYPDRYGKKEKWTADEVSYRNIKWGKHRILNDLPEFVLSYNFGIAHEESGAKTPRAFTEACAGGGQIMNERLRQYSGRWDTYAKFIMKEADIVRERGGHFVICGLDGEGACEMDRTYLKIFTLAGRAHPYLYTYRWGDSSVGTYSQFATRYSELLWHPDWQGLVNAEEVLDVKSAAPIWWQWHATWRKAGEATQILVHLIAEPTTEKAYEAPESLPPRQKDVRVTFKGFRNQKRVASAHAFTAEPQTRSLPVKLEKSDAGSAVIVPEHHYWTVVLLEVAP